ncbi:MAG: hypothetical protein M3371_02995 [Acidobacteriota bacterium]|nr:hypothetical protein [Acidobacteriota bacterium]
MITVTSSCPHCRSTNLVRNGLAPNGKQRYLCHEYGRRNWNNPGSNIYSEEGHELILRAYDERSSLRALSRTFGVARNTGTKSTRQQKHRGWRCGATRCFR